MQIDTDAILRTLEGESLTENGKPATLKGVCINALLTVEPAERLSAEDKVAYFLLAERLYKGGPVCLSAEEVSLLKSRVAKLYVPLVVGQAFRLLEGTEHSKGA